MTQPDVTAVASIFSPLPSNLSHSLSTENEFKTVHVHVYRNGKAMA